MKRTFETDRLILKILGGSHAKLVLSYYIRNKDFLMEWEPIKNKKFYTEEFHKKQLSTELVNIKEGRALRFWILKKDNPKRVIGTIAFSNIVRGAFLSCHLGYKLDKDEINKGYTTEALKKGIDIIFKEYKLHRIEANIMPKNSRSLRIAEKLGFYNEGLAYKYLKINGKWEDHIHMVLLNENA